MAYTLVIEAVGRVGAVEAAPQAAVPEATTRPADAAAPLRRLRRVMAYGPRCPDCAGPLVFGEGCQLCPVCGYSGCGGRR